MRAPICHIAPLSRIYGGSNSRVSRCGVIHPDLSFSSFGELSPFFRGFSCLVLAVPSGLAFNEELQGNSRRRPGHNQELSPKERGTLPFWEFPPVYRLSTNPSIPHTSSRSKPLHVTCLFTEVPATHVRDTIPTQMMADEFNYFRSPIQNCIAEADVELIPVPG